MYTVVVVVLGHMIKSFIYCLFHNVATVSENKSYELSDVVFGYSDISLLSDILLEVSTSLAGHILLDVQLVRELVPDTIFQFREKSIISVLERSVIPRKFEYLELVVFGNTLTNSLSLLKLSRAFYE